MKKVLALVLAVIMVCTMAMAVTVGGGDPYAAVVPDTFANDPTVYDLAPKSQLVFETGELYAAGFDVEAPYTDKEGNFVPEKNFVEIKFGAGADLVASMCWVKTGAGTGAGDYKYVVTLKKDDNKLLDNKADLVINSITASVYGNSKNNTWKFVDKDGKYAYVSAASGNPLPDMLTAVKAGLVGWDKALASTTTNVWVSKFDVGYAPNYLELNEIVAKTTLVKTPTVFGGKMVVKAGVDLDGKTMTKGILDLSDSNIAVNVEVKHGDTFFMAGTQSLTSAAQSKLNRNIADKGAKLKATYNSYAASIPADIQIDNAEGYKLYAVDTTTGDATLIPTTTNAKGITTAKVSSLGYMVLVDGTLTATASSTTGTTTNPGTGANDVVGVAAALAVVALVSGAAISLKK